AQFPGRRGTDSKTRGRGGGNQPFPACAGGAGEFACEIFDTQLCSRRSGTLSWLKSCGGWRRRVGARSGRAAPRAGSGGPLDYSPAGTCISGPAGSGTSFVVEENAAAVNRNRPGPEVIAICGVSQLVQAPAREC